ncbi:hypothetical protein Y032_0003g1478 [Ancylostoma ceylanicum]|uniref:Uncharacterized protein n=1 Tax=Ancylostoma ceylanicum TaxID=53326 RepID=A0A016VYY8_9BILA|nr:hypothetical protein Y032_0003g1478 [Ancylostoma ceylanicum]
MGVAPSRHVLPEPAKNALPSTFTVPGKSNLDSRHLRRTKSKWALQTAYGNIHTVALKNPCLTLHSPLPSPSAEPRRTMYDNA